MKWLQAAREAVNELCNTAPIRGRGPYNDYPPSLPFHSLGL
jgi:hypothetical protein